MDEASLRSMKQSALQKWAVEAGATEEEVDEAVDANDSKSALVALIMGKSSQHRGMMAAVRPPPISTSSSQDPVRLAMSQPYLHLESIPPGTGPYPRRDSHPDVEADVSLMNISRFGGHYVDDEEEDDNFQVVASPDSPMTIGRTNSIRSNREEIEPPERDRDPIRQIRSDTMIRNALSDKPDRSAIKRRGSQEPIERMSSHKERISHKDSQRRGGDDKGQRRRGAARRGSEDSIDMGRMPSGYSGSRRASYASTAYEEEASYGSGEGRWSPSQAVPPFGGMMPPFGGMMPPPLVPPLGAPPPGFMNGNPLAVAAAVQAAMGQVPGMPMMPPPGYGNPMFPPPFSSDLGYPPPGYTGLHQYPMQASNSTGRRGGTERRNSLRSQNSASAGQTNAASSQKAEAEPKQVKPEEQTTLLLRNLPENFTRTTLQDLLNRRGFSGRYDFIYMPMNFRTKASFGYAFVNFVGHKGAQQCFDVFHGYTSWDVPSDKVCDVSWSNMHQGLPAHIDRYRNSPVMHESVEDEYKPAVFAPGTGARAIFPAPTKKLRVPRIRRPGADGHGDEDDMNAMMM